MRKYGGGRKIQHGSGRTIDIPKELPTGSIPGPSFNNAWTTGEACSGPHCGTPLDPTPESYAANLPVDSPGRTDIVGTDRLGNNAQAIPGVSTYTGTETNFGPFTLQTMSGGQRRHSKRSQRSRKSQRKH